MPIAGRIDITALRTNTGQVYIGDVNVSAQAGSEAGFELDVVSNRGDTITLYNQDLYELWIDATVNGEGVFWGSTAEAR